MTTQEKYCIKYKDLVALRTIDGVTWRSAAQWAPDSFSLSEVEKIRKSFANVGRNPDELKISVAHPSGNRETATQDPVKKTGEPRNLPIDAKGDGLMGKTADILTKPWQKNLTLYINILYVLLILGVFFVCLWNIFPYELAVRFVASKFLDSGIVSFVLMLPIIGWFFSFIGNALFWIVGAIVWGVIQLIELLPLIMTGNPGYVRSVLREQESHEQIRPRDDDPGVVRYLKKFYNQLPMKFLATARRLRGWVYVLDMLIVMMVYPPVKEGGISRFFFLLSTGQWGQFDWANIVLMFVTLLAVEAVVKVLIIVNHFRKYLKASKKQPETVSA